MPTVRSQAPLPSAARTVLTFLESVGRRGEAESYLRLFRGGPKQSFAIIVAEAAVVHQALGSLLEQLRFLSQLGLVAPIVVGLFDPSTATSGAKRLAEQLPNLGLVPRIHATSEAQIHAAVESELQHEQIPVIRFEGSERRDLRERFELIGRWAHGLKSRKIVLLRRDGGLGPRGDQPLKLGPGHALPRHSGGISTINLRSDLEALLRVCALQTDEAQLLQHTLHLLRAAAIPGLTVSVTSPLTLLRELFTVKGAGTLVKAGSEIEHRASYASVDTGRLRLLLEASFGRQLDPGFFRRIPLAVYLEADYRGVAIIEPSPVAPYLTKFAVEPLAQGEGIGQDLWQALSRDHDSLLWRSRPANPIAPWYTGICDGMLRLSDWHVFWRGIDTRQVPAAVDEALARPEDLTPPRASDHDGPAPVGRSPGRGNAGAGPRR